ncbi:amino acid permease, partial [Cooperia oncophora]
VDFVDSCSDGKLESAHLVSNDFSVIQISRTLGAEYGGSIGLLFSLANCAGAALYIVGFAETIKQLLIEAGITILDGSEWDIRLVAVITCFVLMAVIVVSPTLESRLQQILLIPLIISVLSFIIGSFISTKNKVAHGYTGYKWRTLEANMLPDFRNEHNFFSVFSVYFPAATGIMAGANISGHLKNPQTAIPRGTLAAIAVSSVIYTAFALVAGATYTRDADGVNEPDQDNPPDCYLNASCPFGLHNYYQVLSSPTSVALIPILALKLDTPGLEKVRLKLICILSRW